MADTIFGHYRVLDLSADLAGPFAARLFGDYGAEVIKIEPPGAGDSARRTGPFHQDDPHPEKSLTYLFLNSNKRGITLNLETSLGKRILLDLAKKADILIESYAPGYLDRLGLGFEALEKVNPRLVITSITPFGQNGPYRDYLGNDLLYQAMSGIMYTSGAYAREPLRHGYPQTLWMAGIIAAYATASALYARDNIDGVGQHVDVSIAESAASHHYTSPIRYIYNGAIERRAPKLESGSTKGIKFEGIVPVKDGYISPTFQHGRQRAPFSNYAQLIGRPDIDNPNYATEPQRQQRLQELDDLLLPILKEWSKFDYFNKAMSDGWIAAVAQTSEDLANCPQLAERGYYTEIEHPVIGRIKMPGEIFRVPEAPWSLRRPAPLLGQHNAEVYCDDLGFTRQELVLLRQQGVI